MTFDRYGGVDVLHLAQRPDPKPGRGEVLVRVGATSVNPVDWKLRNGSMRLYFPVRLPKVLGFDVSGEVVSTGPGVTHLAVGDQVYGMLDLKRDGACAELVVGAAKRFARKPQGLSHEEAAAIPLAGLTAWQAIVEKLAVTASDRVLVTGASGGVGMFAVQIAKAKGAHVTAVTSAKNEAFVRSLGADEVIAYDAAPITGTFDAIFDATGLYPYFGCRRHLSDAGRYCSTLPTVGNVLSIIGLFFGALLGVRRRSSLLVTRPDANDLRELARLSERGSLAVHVEHVYPLEELARAHARSETGRVVGKLVVSVAGGAGGARGAGTPLDASST